jgi:diaminopimelate decarboxylase
MLTKNATTLQKTVKKYGTPLYVYDQEVLEGQCRKLKHHFKGVQFHYACKANSNPELLKVIRKEGFYAEAVSTGEIDLLRKSGFGKKEISFTCSSMTKGELVYASKNTGRVHLDSLMQLESWGALSLGREVSLRLNQGIGAGHHEHVITGGPGSKFGISLRDLPEAQEIIEKYGLVVTSIQQHIGSNVLDPAMFLKAAKKLLHTARLFPDISYIDFGGGLGIPYEPSEKELNLKVAGKEFQVLTQEFLKRTGNNIRFAMEPGRFLVAQAGCLVVEVVDKKKTSGHLFVGVNSGFNHLIRPAMYNSYHSVTNLSRLKGPKSKASIVGNVCESGDMFTSKRLMIEPHIGDILVIENAGAYGMSMASKYNQRALPKEVLITGNGIKDISYFN